jgi:hypothetical protein
MMPTTGIGTELSLVKRNVNKRTPVQRFTTASIPTALVLLSFVVELSIVKVNSINNANH